MNIDGALMSVLELKREELEGQIGKFTICERNGFDATLIGSDGTTYRVYISDTKYEGIGKVCITPDER